ncbi:hypothetical protein [Streptomyces sp. ST2-7A]|uniref:hypothetical protein n=1 Tax=Streptomyces sp. ST2-7A TaxID=2907214 RepID=UPI001F1D7976|nr:hypothetical protein [Streptomyces sp. ST2-7A]MCE7081140.1 hypothetical protein [Streptomyces sp. ST2-7A]
MGRQIRRVPLDFDWPLNKAWHGFLLPDRFDENPCPDCERGHSPHAESLYTLWYGRRPFDPASTGSTPWLPEAPAIRDLAERHIVDAPDHYGSGEIAIACEARRLADFFNARWSHHLSQDDVNALATADRLHDFTHTWSPENGWQKLDPPVTPTAARVNKWSLHGFGHDAINAAVVIRARCEREGADDTCRTCQGHAGIEAYPGQRAEAEQWEPTDPPTGEGWQLWETVSEGSPISPVCTTADELAAWMSDPARGDRWIPTEAAREFIDVGWAPTGVVSPGRGYSSGVEAIGWKPQ